MNFKLKLPSLRQPAPDVPIVPVDEPDATASPVGAVERSVYCTHGIHTGHFPVAGLTVGEARRTLGKLLNIDPEAAAVIAGQVVDEDHVIGADTAMLTFVKKSSIKGSGRDRHVAA